MDQSELNYRIICAKLISGGIEPEEMHKLVENDPGLKAYCERNSIIIDGDRCRDGSGPNGIL